MAVPHNSAADGDRAAEESSNPVEASSSSAASPSQNTKSPGVRVVNGRVYDPEHGKTCHQCRQKTTDFSAPCSQIRRDKPCPIKFCRKCLLNRYGEKAEEVALVENWICPKCRGVCNCSFCMKKKGCQPTGMLIHTAKASGFSSVHELLDNQGSDVLNAANGLRKLSAANPADSKNGSATPTRSRGKENSLDEQKDIEPSICADDNKRDLPEKKEKKRTSKKLKSATAQHIENDIEKNKNVKGKRLLKKHKSRKCGTEVPFEHDNSEVVIPQGMPLIEAVGTSWEAEDVGAALQFLEFCNAFSEVLDINKGEPESVLRELARGCVGRRGAYSSIVKFHVKLLSFIQKDMGEESVSCSTSSGDNWLQSLAKCINESDCALNMPLDGLKKAPLAYDSWDTSDKLRLLNLLCDRTLETEELRNWIDAENKKCIERNKEAKGTIIAAKKRGKDLKKRLKDDVAKAMLSLEDGPPLSVAEQENLVSQIRAETEKTHAEMREIMEQLPKDSDNIRRDAVRTEPLFLEGEGRVYWKLGGCCSNSKIILQDVGSWDSVMLEDKWFAYDDEEEKSIERHISSVRDQRQRKHKRFLKQESGGARDSSNKSTFPNCSTEGDGGIGSSAREQEILHALDS